MCSPAPFPVPAGTARPGRPASGPVFGAGRSPRPRGGVPDPAGEAGQLQDRGRHRHADLQVGGDGIDVVVVLRYLNRFSVERTALAMGIDERTARSLTSQAKARPRARLTPRRLLYPGPATSDQE
ncbi:hypothetical protein [Streptomyces sp. BE303]|uniref:hypothetical protein n=1 Tax=Streptomyces sp. BE303 TaxID=3002528 RepID=UPI002E760122|nr:hypothetical protein [Streptomyces sp. BE303]MED7949678.1 hypothetical protein [Streptomyces sp. BE303]